MPRFVADTVDVAARVGHHETEFRGMTAEPAEGGGALKAVLDGNVGRIANVEGATGVVFAEARGGNVAKKIGGIAAGGEMATNDTSLACDAAKAREGNQCDAIGGGGITHAAPGSGGAQSEADGFFVGRMPTDEHEIRDFGLAEGAHATRAAVV